MSIYICDLKSSLDRFIVKKLESYGNIFANLKSSLDRFIAIKTVAQTAVAMVFKIQFG